jgi:hypothetical protein
MALDDLQRLRITTPREHSPASSRWLLVGWCAASVVVERSRARRRDIATEQVGGGQSAVTEGVRSGQRVVLNPGSVRDGQDVIEE